jgi:hypothetical protein
MHIYYVFHKGTGAFMGSGTPLLNTEEVSSTLVPIEESTENTSFYWNNTNSTTEGNWVEIPNN